MGDKNPNKPKKKKKIVEKVAVLLTAAAETVTVKDAKRNKSESRL